MDPVWKIFCFILSKLLNKVFMESFVKSTIILILIILAIAIIVIVAILIKKRKVYVH